MKVVHLSKYPDGGATWCAMRISNALNKNGIDSKMLLMQGEPSANISIAEVDWLYKRHKTPFVRLLLKVLKFVIRPQYELFKWKRKNVQKSGKAFFSSPLTDYTSLPNHPDIKSADIIHLHWVADFIDYPSFFRKIKKPIVWTIHDEGPGLGGFHYNMHLEDSNDKYKKLDKQFALIKKKAIKRGNRPYLVAISSAMNRWIRDNDILKICETSLIYNGVEGDLYTLYNRELSRESLGFPKDSKIFMFSSYKIDDKRKGLTILVQALERLNDSSIILICVGNYTKIPKARFNVICTGLILDKAILSQYYSSANFFVQSSYQESFGLTPVEAMSCGTPVVAFPCGISPELVTEKNGVLCSSFTVDALYEGILNAMKKDYNREEIRNDVLSRFSYDKITEQYIKLYHSLLNDK